MTDLWQDLRYGARTLWKQPGFTLVVVGTLALGIGINTAVFSVVDAVLFRPLPFANPDQLIEIWRQEPNRPNAYPGLRPEALEVFRSQTQVFDAVEAYSQRSFLLTGGGEPETVFAPAVTPGLFAMLGVHPRLGRPFNNADGEAGNDRVVMVSDAFWRTHLGATPDAIGKTLTLDGQAHVVIGVMPPKFKFPTGSARLWSPLVLKPTGEEKRPGSAYAVARLRSDVTVPTAQGVLGALGTQLQKERPDPGGWGVKLTALSGRRVNPGPRKALLVLFGAVGFVLLIACANAANLLLARAANRQGEIAIRLAMGAGRGRLIRQLLTESLILSVLGGGLGVILAWVGVDALARIVPSELTFLSVSEINLDPRVLLFTLGITLLTGLAFGLAPAVRTSRPNLRLALGGSAGHATSDRANNRLRNALVVIEVALSLVLLIGAGLMMRSFLHLAGEPVGFDPKNLIAATLNLPRQHYPTLAYEEDFLNRLKTTLGTIPGVEAITLASGVPPQGGGITFDLDVEIEGRLPLPKDPRLILPFSRADTTYFKTLRIPILRGRAFGAEDTISAPPAMIINEEMARQYWSNEDPVGHRIRFSKEAKWQTVVGVSGDVKLGNPGSGFSRMEIYYPLSQVTGGGGQRTLIVRTTTDAEQMLTAVKGAIHMVDKNQPIYRIDTVETRLSDALAEPRFYLLLFACFAGLTLLLVSMGIYGVMAHAVAQRTREIGIRVAIGAGRKDVLSLILKRGMTLTLAGVCVGIAASLSLSRVTAAILFGVPATDPTTFAGVALLLTAVAGAACWIPALRATKVDPLTALRQE